jgi:hypothetical protein
MALSDIPTPEIEKIDSPPFITYTAQNKTVHEFEGKYENRW